MVYDTIGASTVDWAGRTYEGIEETAGRDGSVAVVPVGSIEQHGRHLAVATDTVLADAVAHLGAERASDDGVPVLVTPPVWSGFSPHHTSIGGTLTARLETIQDLLRDVVRSAIGEGFDAVLLVNGHGGNSGILGSLPREIGAEHPDVEVLGLTYWSLAAGFVDELRDSELGGMSHAGEFETSLMMHLRPELVREDAREGTPRDEPYPQSKRDMFAAGSLSDGSPTAERTESGAVGSPEVATAEKGAELYDRLGDELCDLLIRVHGENR